MQRRILSRSHIENPETLSNAAFTIVFGKNTAEYSVFHVVDAFGRSRI